MTKPAHLAKCALLAALALAPHAMPRAADACAVAMPEGPPPGLKVASEEAYILYDPAAHLEHFIRTANFSNVAGPFAFLVPTPSEPALAEASLRESDDAHQQLVPRVDYQLRRPLRPVFGCVGALMLSTRSAATVSSIAVMPETAATGAVTVLAHTSVAGLDATVLQADAPGALSTWLGSHGFSERPALTAWLAPYVAAHWMVTVFRYVPAAPGESLLHTAAVRMSFRTDAPVYPYRETSDAARPDDTRLLRVFLFAPERRVGRVGDAPWSATPRFSDTFENGEILWGELTGARPSFRPWLTVFDDHTVVRPPRDVTFVPDPGPPVPREVRVEYRDEPRLVFLPLEPVALILLAVWLWRRRVARRRA